MLQKITGKQYRGIMWRRKLSKDATTVYAFKADDGKYYTSNKKGIAAMQEQVELNKTIKAGQRILNGQLQLFE